MKKGKLRGPLLAAIFVAGVFLNIQYGESGGHEHGFNMNEHGFYILDVIFFIFLVGPMVRDPARNFLKNRYETIRSEIDTAGSILKGAQGRLADHEGKLRGLETESQEILTAFTADGERDKTRVESDTDGMIEKLKRDLDLRMAQEESRTRSDLRHHVSVQALGMAEQKIQAAMDQATQRRLIRQYIDDLKTLAQLSDYRQKSA